MESDPPHETMRVIAFSEQQLEGVNEDGNELNLQEKKMDIFKAELNLLCSLDKFILEVKYSRMLHKMNENYVYNLTI